MAIKSSVDSFRFDRYQRKINVIVAPSSKPPTPEPIEDTNVIGNGFFGEGTLHGVLVSCIARLIIPYWLLDTARQLALVPSPLCRGPLDQAFPTESMTDI
jgi:hypothetical protein